MDSHSHFDHTGDMTRFPSSTSLVVGSGTLKAVIPAFPDNKDSINLQSDFE
jgi:hypothetical protein